jgi:hypothetical protein
MRLSRDYWRDLARRMPVVFGERKLQILILSGADRLRFPPMLNHKLYADMHGYRYRFDLTPSRHINLPYFHKIAKIADALEDADWIFWIDDDAAFTQLEMRLEIVVPEMLNPNLHLIFCRSPVNLQGGWTYLSSGNFFIRNSKVSQELLSNAREELLPKIETWWDSSRFGMFTGGDQDVLVYLIMTEPRFQKATAILEYERFNTRPYHFNELKDHFLVHFTHQPDRSKADQMRDFAKLFSLSPFIVPKQLLEPYGRYPDLLFQMIGKGEWHH